MSQLFRAGDVVRHKPSKEIWTLVCDQENGNVFPGGYPASVARAQDCELVEEGSPQDRRRLLNACVESGGLNADRARRQLAAEAP